MHVLLMYSPDPPRPGHVRRLKTSVPEGTVTVASSEAEARAAAPTADVILGHRYLRQVLPHAPRLRWVQSTSGDTDQLPEATLSARGILLTRCTAGAPLVARHAQALAWALTRAVPAIVQQQTAQTWDKALPLLPAPTRALILGTGSIGRALATLLQADGVRVTGVNRTASPAGPSFDALLEGSSWRRALPTTDWCFLTLPSTPSTQNMMDAAALRALPAHAVLVNVGRGETLDLKALSHQLRNGHLGGAALDVLPHALEPLSPMHPLWDIPRLLLSPHVAGYDPSRPDLVEPFVEAQLSRFCRGAPPHDVVSPTVRSSHPST